MPVKLKNLYEMMSLRSASFSKIVLILKTKLIPTNRKVGIRVCGLRSLNPMISARRLLQKRALFRPANILQRTSTVKDIVNTAAMKALEDTDRRRCRYSVTCVPWYLHFTQSRRCGELYAFSVQALLDERLTGRVGGRMTSGFATVLQLKVSLIFARDDFARVIRFQTN